KRVMLAYILICLCGGFLLSYFMAKKNYTPIRRLTRIFLDRLGGNEEGAERDFPFLEGALQKLLQEHADLEDTIHKQNETARGSLLARLIECHPSQTAGVLESCKTCGIEFPTGNFLLLAALVDDEGTTNAGHEIPGDTGSDALDRYMLHHTLSELTCERHTGYVTDVAGLVMCLVSLSIAGGQDPGWEETYEEIASITRKVRDLFRSKFGIGLSFAVSSVHENPSAMPAAAAEVDRIVESIVLFDKRDVTIMAGDASTAEALAPAAGSLVLHRTIADLACAGDFASVSVEVGKYLEREFADSQMPLATAKLRMSGVMNIISEILSDLRPSLDRSFLEELNPVDRLSHVKSIPELRRQVDEIFAHLEAHFRERKEEQPICLKDQAARYVEENFRDRNLNVNAIADRFGVSASHLSRAFKKEAGIGLLDYLHIVRVREAKVLIGEGRMSIEEIAGAVGCGSRITLARAFKRYEGVAPAVFRDRE
ncbi:MAG: helix-turn-helix transcriptional regulator, partial [Rectinemataceae bacterium]|nr:helix-turn-helix transcriptional regulator [Rectinemataceae bacterium]